ncbi:MAG: calcium-binding protein [Gammaproteobacteria bacterium]|nr:calcium-binding protein [Gammaproteobacteria bacterium]
MYTIVSGDNLSKIAKKHGVSLVDLLAANPHYKADPNNIRIGDPVVIPAQAPAPVSVPAVEPEPEAAVEDDAFIVPFGQLTFDAEGLEQRGKYFSRSPHVPGPSSGITIGRGYDLGSRSANEIIADLIAAGVDRAIAVRFGEGRGYKGQKARNLIRRQQLDQIEITPQQQNDLFLITYQELEGDVIRICSKHDIVEKYGQVNWNDLHAALRDITVDLRYRGDYTGATREVVQPMLVRNDLDDLKNVLADRNYWVTRYGVPPDRFKRRNEYLQKIAS